MQPTSNTAGAVKYTFLQFLDKEERLSNTVKKALEAIDRLVQDLEAEQNDGRGLRKELIERAFDATYSDNYSATEVNPQLTLMTDLLDAGYRDLCDKATRNEYNH